MTAINATTFHVFGFTEAKMNNPEAKYLAEEAADRIEASHAAIRACLDNFGEAAFSQIPRILNEMERQLYLAETALTEARSSLSKIKVGETA